MTGHRQWSTLTLTCPLLFLFIGSTQADFITAPTSSPPMPVGNIYSSYNSGGTEAADTGIAANTVVAQPLNVVEYGAVPDAHWGDPSCSWSAGGSSIQCGVGTFSNADNGKTVILDLATDTGGLSYVPLVTYFGNWGGIDSSVMPLTDGVTTSHSSNISLVTALDPHSGANGSGYLPGDTVCLTSTSICATVNVVTPVSISAHSNGSDGTDCPPPKGCFVMDAGTNISGGSNNALAGQPFILNVTISGGAIATIKGITRSGNYDVWALPSAGEPVLPAVQNAEGQWVFDPTNPLTGATVDASFGVPAGGLALNRASTNVYSGTTQCKNAGTTGGHGTLLAVDCSTITPTASWGTDNTTAFKNALAAMNTFNTAGTSKCLYIPAGNYLTNVWNTPVTGRNDYCGDSTWDLWLSNVYVIPNMEGDMIEINDAGVRPGQGQGGTVALPNNAGCGVNGITFVGMRESTAIQNAVMIYGPAIWCHFGYYAYYMRGRALGVGSDDMGKTSLAESILDDYRFEQDGDVDYTDPDTGKLVHVPTIDITALGGATINNVRSKTGRIYQSFGAGVRIADCGSGEKGSHNVTLYGGTHLEASGMAGTGAGGDIVQLGDENCANEWWPYLPDSGGPVSGTNSNVGGIVVDADLTNPQYGHAALRIEGSTGNLAHNISGGIDIGGAVDALGKGVVEESCQNCQMHFANNAPQDYQLTAISPPDSETLGANNTYSANSGEGSLTTNLEASQQPTGSTPQQYPVWTSRPNFPTWSTASGLTAFPGGGITYATPLTAGINSIGTVKTAGDSVILEPSWLGGCQIVINNGANAMQVWGNTSNGIPDVINGAASVSQIPNTTVTYCVSLANNWSAMVPTAGLQWFGDGSDGTVAISSGTTTLTRDMYYADLTISSSGVLKTAGYKVFVSGTLDISNAASGAIQNDGNAGSSTTGGAAASANTVDGGQAGAAAGNGGTSTVGGSGSAAGSSACNIGATAGRAGFGGTAGSLSGGSAGAGGTSLSPITDLRRLQQELVVPCNGLASFVIPGSGGGGGGGGAGFAGGTGGNGGGGGGGGGTIYLAAQTINRGSLTSASAIQVLGGNGAIGTTPTSGSAGGGGGGGGGDGGWIYLIYGSLAGATASNCLDATGGTGGGGGNATAGGNGGDGGGGGAGGRIDVYGLATGTQAITGTVPATIGNSHSGTTGGASKAATTHQVTL